VSSTTIRPGLAEEFFVEPELTRVEGMVDGRQTVWNLTTVRGLTADRDGSGSVSSVTKVTSVDPSSSVSTESRRSLTTVMADVDCLGGVVTVVTRV